MDHGGNDDEPASDDERSGLDAELTAAVAALADGDQRSADAIARRLGSDADPDLLDAVAAAAAAGSPAALDVLLGAVQDLPIARAAIRRLLVDADAADDVLQDVLIAVAERIGSFRGTSRFTTWLYQVARFKTIDHLRRQRDSTALNDDDELVFDHQRISSMIASRSAIRAALDGLPEHYRSAVILRDLDQLPYDEIAARSEIPLNTAKTRVARGRALLAGRLGGSR